MLTFFTVLAILPIPLTLAAGGAVSFLLVPDPTGVTQCDPYTIKWQGGTPPYSVTVQDPVNAGDIYAFWAVVEDTSIEWTVDDLTGVTFPLAFLISVVDATGDNAMSRAETIQAATVPLDSSGLCTTTGSTDSTSSSSSSTTSASSSAASTNSNTKSQTSSETASQASKPGSSDSAIVTASAAQSSNSSATSTADASSASGAVTTTKKVSSGAIAGAVVGGVALLAFVGTAFQVLHKRHQRRLLADLTEADYHLTLDGKKSAGASGSIAMNAVEEKPLPAFYEHPTPSRTPPQHSLPSSGYHHDAPSIQTNPSSRYYHNHQPSAYHDAQYQNGYPQSPASQQKELERQINVMQQEINEMQYSSAVAHTQALQNQMDTMRAELERLHNNE